MARTDGKTLDVFSSRTHARVNVAGKVSPTAEGPGPPHRPAVNGRRKARDAKCGVETKIREGERASYLYSESRPSYKYWKKDTGGEEGKEQMVRLRNGTPERGGGNHLLLSLLIPFDQNNCRPSSPSLIPVPPPPPLLAGGHGGWWRSGG